jgi:hypothetical protein
MQITEFQNRIGMCALVATVAACAPKQPLASATYAPLMPSMVGTSVSYSTEALAPIDTATPEPPTAAIPTHTTSERADKMKIRITLDDAVLMATLVDSQTTRDFVALLPLRLTLEDYAGTEKVSDLPRRLSTEGAPPGSDPSVGDITYYAPWGNLAIFYREFGYANGLVILGRIDSGIEALDVGGSVDVDIELIE